MISQKRAGRAHSLILKLAADFIKREIDAVGVLVTATRIEITPGFKEAKIFISVWPEGGEKEIMRSLENSKKELYKYMKERFKIKYMPVFEFKIDKGEKARMKVEEILKKEK
ncbi:MAG: ribosome-binding factor A [Candidatus Niyogibacteria bacterium]|nr:ribosome-binding factor A [Candidatus Niyogibacteria bacterium]